MRFYSEFVIVIVWEKIYNHKCTIIWPLFGGAGVGL